ncbi:MAG: Mfa1 family fimbria major subunit [Bacteroides sp.]|nr:Mfa1 family fimbria major subunit [Bacteroides sp.]
MSNFKGEVFIDGDDLKTTTQAAEANPFPVTVDRGVAKVSVTNSITTVNGATIADFGWKSDIINKKMYWMRMFAKIAGGATGGAMETTQLDRYSLYAEDPNFTGVSIQSSTGGSQYPAEFFYHTLATTGTFFSTGDYDYVTENTMAADEQYEDVTTRVIIKLNYIPNGLSAGDGYFVFGTMLITEQALKDMMSNQANTSLKLLDAVAAAKLAGYIDSSNEVINKNYSFSIDGLKYYAKGVCYYAVPIRHFDDTQAPNLMDYGRYGVVRNNYYKVNVKSVTFPGEPDIPGPEGPDDKERVYISADITIQDWFLRGQDVSDL